MTYFTIQRIATFLTGIGILYLAYLTYQSTTPLVEYALFAMLLLLGIYIVIASLIPYKNTTKNVSEIVFEGLAQFFVEYLFEYLIVIPIRFFLHLFGH